MAFDYLWIATFHDGKHESVFTFWASCFPEAYTIAMSQRSSKGFLIALGLNELHVSIYMHNHNKG